MISRPDQACYCACCCLSDDPADSCDKAADHGPYNRRYDCSCKQRWPVDPLFKSFDHFTRAAVMRCRDLGRDPFRLANAALELLNFDREPLEWSSEGGGI